MSYPVFLDHSPPENSINVPKNSNIFFRVEDDDGLNLSTLTVLIEGVKAIENGVYQTGYVGTITPEDATPTAISVLINPNSDFNYSQEINVAASIDDNLGTTGNEAYKFLTIANPDQKPPEIAANPHGGIYNSAQTVTLASDEVNTVIYYTLDGSEPDLSSSVYTAPLSISDEGETTLKFFGVDTSGLGNSSSIITEEYEIDTIAPTTIADPSGGNFFRPVTVTLTSDDHRATIFFTINGQEPTTSSTIYTAPISLPDNQNTIVKFFAMDQAGNQESVNTESYTIEIAKNNIIAQNVMVVCPYTQGMLEVRWEDMYPIHTNIRGYNVYRSDVEIGPYQKLTREPVSINYYQDKTLDVEILEEDVSEQFRRTVAINNDINDDFEGSHYDVTKWKENDLAELMFQFNGLLFVDRAGITRNSQLTSIFKLTGDFDIQTGFDLLDWNTPVQGVQSCLFKVKLDDNNYIQIGRERSASINVYNANKYTNGNPDLPSSVSTTDEYGTYRFTRVGNVITAYFYDANADDFVSIISFTAYEDDVYVEYEGKSSDVPVEFRWRNFTLNSGSPVIIEPRNQLQEYVAQVSRLPIVDSSGTNKPTDEPSEVEVTINGQLATIKKVCGLEGTIYLESQKVWDEVKREWFEPIIPNETSEVLVTYKTKLHTTKVALRKKYFYKVTVVTDEDETDLDLIKPEYLAPEKITYIFAEAVRRNAWILDQAGERVLFFAKKKAGEICPCTTTDVKQRTHRKPDQDCNICYGSGFVGGFDGPWPIIIAPLTTEQRISHTERGLGLKYQIETWTGPTPLMQQRDMIVRRNCDRCLIGPITPAEGPGGVILQQHFTIENLDTTDIRYKFPLQPLPNQLQQPGIDKAGTKLAEIHSPQEREELVTNKGIDSGTGRKTIIRGRSMTFENKNY